MNKAIYAGSFDPITNGHIDIIKRAAKIFDILYVGVLNNSSKNPLFSNTERVSMIEEALVNISNVKVISFDGLLIDFCKDNEINTIIRGLRGVSDFEIEMQIANANKKMSGDIETIFLASSPEYSYISSTVVREFASYHADLKDTVPENVKNKLIEKYK